MKSVLSDAIENAFVDAVNSDKINLFKIKLVVDRERTVTRRSVRDNETHDSSIRHRAIVRDLASRARSSPGTGDHLKSTRAAGAPGWGRHKVSRGRYSIHTTP
jgi:hypothetical protein